MTQELAYMPAHELTRLYRLKTVSPVEVVQSVLQRIDTFNPRYNAYRMVDHEGALQAARSSEARWMRAQPLGLLDGVPTSIKDSHHVKGWSTLHGSRLTRTADIEPLDSPHVARLRDHGAVFLGKTNLCEQGWKCVTDSPLTGISRNPWNPDLTPGGSSGGAAIAAAAGMGTINMGGDGGGSIRLPASFCGLVGMKATYGRVPRYPQESLIACAHFGPLTRSVAEAALVMNVITRPDRRDVTALPFDDRDYLQGLDAGVKGMRIGYCDTLGDSFPVAKDIEATVRSAVNRLADAGALVTHVPSPIRDTFEAYKTLNSAYQVPKIHGRGEDELDLMDATLVANAHRGEGLSAYDLLHAGYARASWIEQMAEFFQSFDILVTPTSPVSPFEAGRNNPRTCEDAHDLEDRVYCLFNGFLYPFNYTHHPAVTVPCGLDGRGLPVGLQIVTRHKADHLGLIVARAVERSVSFQGLKLALSKEETSTPRPAFAQSA